MIQLENIRVSFRKEKQRKLFGTERQTVLHGISLEVREGECLGILGASGSGKSTIGRVILGLLRPDSGTVKLRETDIYRARDGRKKLQEYASVVFQDYTTSVNPRFTIRDILAEGIYIGQKKQKAEIDYDAESEHLLEMVHLPMNLLGRYPHELSGGQLQRVCIARTLACKPKFILFDEAVSSLDAHTQVEVMDVLRELKDSLGLTYIFITHDLTTITYLCDRVVFLRNGSITAETRVDELRNLQDEYAQALMRAVMDFTMPEKGKSMAEYAG